MNDTNDPELERRLAQLRQIAEPRQADKRRVLEAVRASALVNAQLQPSHGNWPLLDPSLDVARSGAASAGKRAARRLYPWLGGALIGGVVGVALGVGWARSEGSRSELAETSAATPPSNATPAPAAGPLPTLTPAAVQVTPPGAVVPAAGSVRAIASGPRRQEPIRQPKLDLAGALELLHQAEQALHAGDSELALGLLNDLDRRAERASLRQERLTTLVLALCQQRRIEAARLTRQELQSEFPGSIYTSRLDRSCAREAEPR